MARIACLSSSPVMAGLMPAKIVCVNRNFTLALSASVWHKAVVPNDRDRTNQAIAPASSLVQAESFRHKPRIGLGLWEKRR